MPPFTDLAGAYGWLDSQVNYERILGAVAYGEEAFELEGFRRRLAALGNPHQGLRSIHIAGTRGKGSAALALEALLGAAGLRTAVYTSPHLREYRERIRLGGQPIAGDRFTALLARIAETAAAQPEPAGASARYFKTVFENLTALYFLAAQGPDVDWTVVETGLGGRLDATNVLDPGPVLLTRIGLEHTHLLGDTIPKIAAEKAAILKPGGWGVAAAQDEAGGAMEVFERRAREVGARLDRAADLCPIHQVRPTREGLTLAIGFEGRRLDMHLPLFGTFQAENLQNALAMLARLREERRIPITSDETIIEALSRLRVPGRMERVLSRPGAPEVFVDGGHCPTAATALARTMAGHFGTEPAGLIVGMMAEKDHEAFLAALARWPGWRWIWLYPPPSARAADPETLAEAARRFFCYTRVFQNLEQVLNSLPHNADDVSRIVATGSLYSVARFEDWGADYGRLERKEQQDSAQAEQEPDR